MLGLRLLCDARPARAAARLRPGERLQSFKQNQQQPSDPGDQQEVGSVQRSELQQIANRRHEKDDSGDRGNGAIDVAQRRIARTSA